MCMSVVYGDILSARVLSPLSTIKGRRMKNGLGSFLFDASFSARPFRQAGKVLFFVSLTSLLGCGGGDGLNRKAISGKVTVDGAAVPNGSVNFEPLYQGGVGSGAVITKGAYKIEQKDGLPPGKYRVQITGDDGTNFGVSPGKMPGDEDMPPIKQLVPASWNSGSKHEIEVKAEGPFEFDFAIDSKAK